jgi:putative ABC transport system permease protein
MWAVNRNLLSGFENIRIAIASVFSNRLRAFLTMIGITIGVAGVVLLLSVGEAFEKFLIDQFFGSGTNIVTMFAGSNPGEDTDAPLTQSELEALSDPLRVPDASVVAALLTVNGRSLSFDNRERDASIFGITPSYADLEQREIVAGRYLDETDNNGAARVAVIGSSVVENLFPPGVPPLGENIRIGNVQFEVIGILDEGGSGGFVDLDNTVFVPMRTAQTRLSNQRSLDGDYVVTQILFQARSEQVVDAVVQQITDVMREERDITFNDEDSWVVGTQDDFVEAIEQILGLLASFLAAIASISLLVGGIGIMNIMLVTVTERTKEIGLRKAVGAKNYEILLQFVTEAVFISMLGGAVGIGIAGLGGALISAIPGIGLEVGLSQFAVILAVGISTAIGVFFGYFPAQRAARLNPIDALRYE